MEFLHFASRLNVDIKHELDRLSPSNNFARCLRKIHEESVKGKQTASCSNQLTELDLTRLANLNFDVVVVPPKKSIQVSWWSNPTAAHQ